MKVNYTGNKQPRIEMMPLIDIVFLLLVFFIYAMLSMTVHHGMVLNLPESSQAIRTTEKAPFSLFIQEGEAGLDLLLNKEELSLPELRLQLLETLDNQQDIQILIFAEESISYQQLYTILDVLKSVGISDIYLQASSEK